MIPRLFASYLCCEVRTLRLTPTSPSVPAAHRRRPHQAQAPTLPLCRFRYFPRNALSIQTCLSSEDWMESSMSAVISSPASWAAVMPVFKSRSMTV